MQGGLYMRMGVYNITTYIPLPSIFTNLPIQAIGMHNQKHISVVCLCIYMPIVWPFRGPCESQRLCHVSEK